MSLLSLANSDLHMTGAVIDLSIPLEFDGPQPNHFGAARAQALPMQAGEFTGDTRLGGSCNAHSLTLNPHCNGTHTECVGHLTTTRVSINDVCPALPLLAGLVTASTTEINYKKSTARALTLSSLQPCVSALFEQSRRLTNSTPSALVIRTLPNAREKTSRQYRGLEDSAFIEPEAIEWLVQSGVDHLLVDVPSIDPYIDGGELVAHRVMFGLPSRANCPIPELGDASRPHATITELIYVADEVNDGLYLLNLQIPPFCIDAAPSRPLLYSLESP